MAVAAAVDHDLRGRLAEAVAARFPEQRAFLEDLARLPSLRGAEFAAQDLMAGAFRARGYRLDRYAMDRGAIEAHPGGGRWSAEHSEAPIVTAIHHPREERGRSLILQAHLDVVPAGPAAMWRHPPFEPVVEGDWMAGRGVADMKAGATANLFALDALAAIGLQPAATVYVHSVVEEESTGNGALMTHLRGYRAEAALIPEPEGERLVRANVGVLWFALEVGGRPAHVADMGEGANAIDAAWRLVAALRRLEAAWNERRADSPHFRDDPHPINLNVGRIEGGDWASSVPSWCRVHCRISILPGEDPAVAARAVEDAVAEAARDDPFLANNPPAVVFDGFHARGYVLEPGSAAEAALAGAHEAAIGAPLETLAARAYLDARVHALYDAIPALCYGPVGRDIHAVDEAVSLASLERITLVIALFVAGWCGVEPLSRPVST